MSNEFEPRRAEPDQEFTYTTSEERLVEKGEIPDGAAVLSAIDPDTGEPYDGGKLRVRIDGVHRTLKANGDGIVHPKNADDVRILDGFDLPVARKAAAERKAEKREEAAPAAEMKE